MVALDYPHVEHQNGVDIYYFLLPNLTPVGVRIEPIYTEEENARYADGRMAKPKRRLLAINVYGVYE